MIDVLRYMPVSRKDKVDPSQKMPKNQLGNGSMDGFFHSGMQFTPKELRIVEDGVRPKHSGLTFSDRELGVIDSDLTLEDFPDAEAPLPLKSQLFRRRIRIVEQKPALDGSSADVGMPSIAFLEVNPSYASQDLALPPIDANPTNRETVHDLVVDENELAKSHGGLEWQKHPSGNRISEKHTKPKEVGVVDWNREQKIMHRKRNFGLGLIATFIPGFILSGIAFQKDSVIMNLSSIAKMYEFLGSLVADGSGLILLEQAIRDYFDIKSKKEESGKTGYNRQEQRRLHEPYLQQHPLVSHTQMLDDQPYFQFPNRVGVLKTVTPEGDRTIDTLVFDGKKRFLRR